MTKIEGNLCRICEQYTNNFLNASTSRFKSIVAKYLALAEVTFEINDGLPKSFCKKCIKALNLAHDFKVQCELAYNRFPDLLKPIEPPMYVLVNGESSDNDNSGKHEMPQNAEHNGMVNDLKTVEIKIEPDIGNINTDRKNVVKHISKPEREKEFECTNCSTTFVHKKNLLRHMRVQHHHQLKIPRPTDQNRKVCNLCDKTFFDLSSLGRHKKRIHFRQELKNYSKKTPCEMCGRIFATVTTKNRHINVVHKAERLFVCTICGLTFGQMPGLQNHMVSLHSEERKFKCDKCPSAFKIKSSLFVHQNTHLPKEERKKYNYTRYRQYNKERQKRYNNRRKICEICGQSVVVSGMQGHMRRHDGLKPFECTVCSKRFSTKQMLQRHKVIHSTERRYKCELCDKTFRQFSVLRRHRIWHTGEKAYKCSYCEKAFFQSFNLRLHERTHTGERPYECNVCAETFLTSAMLRRHTTAVHLEGKATIGVNHPLEKIKFV